MTDEDLELRSTLTLLSEARAGNARAADVLLDRHRRALRRWGRGRLPPSARDLVDTEDLVQEVLSRTFRRLDRFEPEHSGAFRGYLRRSFLRLLLDERRRARRRPTADDTANAVADPGGSPQEIAMERERLDRYERALSRLDPFDREAVIARVEIGLRYDDIAQALGRPSAEAARKLVTRAVNKLGKLMAAEEDGDGNGS
jgi:RNA polymerase sigma-70 factor, ECF subfamily